jgi:hypothetical protein
VLAFSRERVSDMPPKRSVKKGGGHDVNRLKEIARPCSEDAEVQRYVKKMVDGILDLVLAFASAKGMTQVAAKRKFLCREQCSGSAGQFLASDVDEVIRQGNIRERMTLLMNFHTSGCEVVMWAASLVEGVPTSVDQRALKSVRDRIMLVTGLKISDLYKLNCTNETGCLLPCSFAFLSKDGPVTFSRTTEKPFVDKVRDRRDRETCRPYTQTIGSVFPPLSTRELSYMGLSPLSPKSTPLPWITGAMYWVTQDGNIYSRIATAFDQMTVAGPSGTTDMTLSCFSLLKAFDLRLSILASVGWMCDPPDHSPFEILMAAIPFGCDFVASKDAFEYVQDLLKGKSAGVGAQEGGRPVRKRAPKNTLKK